MTTKQKVIASNELALGEEHNSRIAAEILGVLGRPGDLLAVHVRRLWDRSYRVNVVTGALVSATIAHSYFLTTDANGKILETSPRLARHYHPSEVESLSGT